jgi:hypothetical protein
MKTIKTLGCIAAVAVSMAVFAAPASATTLKTKGVAENAAITLKASLEGSSVLTDTNEFWANTCTNSSFEGTTSTFTGATVAGPIKSLRIEKCTEEFMVVDAPGSFTITNIAGTTNGTVRSIGTKVTSPSAFGALTCTTAASPGTDIGTLTGVKEGTATIDIKAVLNCGFFLPSAKWEGSYAVTSPLNLGVGA